MHSATASDSARNRRNVFRAGPALGSVKPTAEAVRCALTLAVFSILLLIAAPRTRAQEITLYNFKGGSDGAGAFSSLTFRNGNLYGTTTSGGTGGGGTVFELSPSGIGGWNETVLYNFCSAPNCTDGMGPTFYPVVFDSAGNLYGTTLYGGVIACGSPSIYCGVAFELSPTGASWTENVLYNFGTNPDGGFWPNGLILGADGNLYGMTEFGGNENWSTVFELSQSGGGWTEKGIYQSAIGTSETGVAMDASRKIFGATDNGTDSVYGTVFELAPGGINGWTSTVIYNFTGPPKDGYLPKGTPSLDSSGNLYGTTNIGGANGYGTVYKLTPGKSGKWTEKVLHSFKGGPKDGSNPSYGAVAFDVHGNIYGTTSLGGTYGLGTVYELVAPVGGGAYTEKLLWSFNGTDGNEPLSGLILDGAGNLYGTAEAGGPITSECVVGCGVVFEINPSAAATTTTLSSSPNPSAYTDAVTFTAVVAPAPPNGETVSFMEGSTVLGTGSLTGGSASLTTSTLNVGTTSVTVVYGGDLNLGGSTSKTLKQMVRKAANITYKVNLTVGAGSVSGTIITNGFMGGGVSIVDWNLVVNDGTTAFDLTGRNSDLFDHAGPGDLSATPTLLLFNFSDTSVTNFFYFVNVSPTFPQYVACFESIASTCWPGLSSGEVIAFFTGTGVGDILQFTSMSGTQVIGTAL